MPVIVSMFDISIEMFVLTQEIKERLQSGRSFLKCKPTGFIYFGLFPLPFFSVGKVGQNSLTACGGDLLKAKDIFKTK